MGRIVVTEFISLDGVVELHGAPEDFKHTGWSSEFHWSDEATKFKVDETLASAELLLGRVTYEEFAASWPSEKDAVADKLNSMPKHVVSSTLENPEWTNSTVLEGDLTEAVSNLRQSVDGDVVVHGSIQLAQGLFDRDLVDEVHLMVYPVVLGAGRRLFGETRDKLRLRLTESRTVEESIAILIYERDRT